MKFSSSERRLLAVLACVQIAHILEFVMMMPLGPQLMREFLITSREFSYLVAAYQVSATVSGFIASFFIDRVDRKRALTWMYSGCLVATFLCAIAPTFEIFLTARLVAGAFGGVLATSVFSMIGDAFPEERRGSATGVVMAAFSIASVLGVPASIAVANAYGWHAPFAGLVGIGLLVLGTAQFWIPSFRAHLIHLKPLRWRREVSDTLHLLSDRDVLFALAFSSSLMIAGFLVIPMISPMMVFNVGVSERDLDILYFVGGSTTFVTSQIIGRLSDRFGKYEVFRIVAAGSIIPALWVTHMTASPLWMAALAMACFMVLTSGRFVPATSMLTSVVKSGARGRFMSLNSSVQNFSAGIGSLSVGLITSQEMGGPLQNYYWAGYLAAGMTLVSLILGAQIKNVTKVSSGHAHNAAAVPSPPPA